RRRLGEADGSAGGTAVIGGGGDAAVAVARGGEGSAVEGIAAEKIIIAETGVAELHGLFEQLVHLGAVGDGGFGTEHTAAEGREFAGAAGEVVEALEARVGRLREVGGDVGVAFELADLVLLVVDRE